MHHAYGLSDLAGMRPLRFSYRHEATGGGRGLCVQASSGQGLGLLEY
jgi:hypothetical protein